MDDPYAFFPKFQDYESRSPSPSVPSKFWLVVGNGESDLSSLNAFDAALLNAGIGHLNLIRYSSILPENASISPPPVDILPGSRTGAILAVAEGAQGDIISSGIAFGKVESITPHYIVFEAHGNFDRIELQRRLQMMIVEALSLRNSEESRVFMKVNGLEVTREFGCSIVAVVFDPTVYS